MKKITSIVILTAFLAVQPVMGQIIFTEEDVGLNQRAPQSSGELEGLMVPLQNSNLDQFITTHVPLGNGLWVLIGLGGGYLLKKKSENRKQKKEDHSDF